MESNEKTINIALVHPSEIVRYSLCLMLKENGYNVKVDFPDCGALEATECISGLDLILIHLSQCVTPDVIKKVKQQTGVMVALILSSDSYHNDNMLIAEEKVEEGVSGILDLNARHEDFLSDLQGVCSGSFVVSKGLVGQLLHLRENKEQILKEQLTEREIEILKMIALGYTNKEIGDEMFISLHTVKAHVSTILSKLQLKNRQNAVAYAIVNGFVK